MVDISKGKLFCCGPFFFVLASFILSQFASKQCHYAAIPSGSYLNQRYLATDLGIWCYTIKGGRTISYTTDGRLDDETKGTLFRTAQGFSIATTTLGAIVIIIMCLLPCCGDRCDGPKTNGCAGFLLLLTCICEGCTFLFLNSELCTCTGEPGCACSLGTGGNCGIAACVLWFVSAVLTCGLAKADPGGEEGAE